MVDDAGHLLGRITIDDVVDVIAEMGGAWPCWSARRRAAAPVRQGGSQTRSLAGINLITALIAAGDQSQRRDHCEGRRPRRSNASRRKHGRLPAQTLTLVIRDRSDSSVAMTLWMLPGIYRGCLERTALSSGQRLAQSTFLTIPS